MHAVACILRLLKLMRANSAYPSTILAVPTQDARAPLGQLQGFYTQLVLLVRRLFQECRLVHADLSEYNILVNQARLPPLLCWGQS